MSSPRIAPPEAMTPDRPAPAPERPDMALVGRIPRSARTVVEIGCGNGLQGAVYKAWNPSAYYVGIDDRPAADTLAHQRLNRLQIGSLNQIAISGLSDCLLYNHTLERMVDPWGSIKRHVASLAPDGVIVAAIANIQSADNVIRMLQGQWPPAGSDAANPQLRFFTRDGAIALFRDAGLEIHDIHEEPLAEPGQIAQRFGPLLDDLGLANATMAPLLAARRFIIRAGRRLAPPLLLQNATLVPGPGQSQVIEIRVRQPMEFLATVPGIEVVQESFRDLAIRDRAPETAKICILQRIILTKEWGLALVRHLVRAGYLLIGEWDDNPDHWPAIAANQHFPLRGVHALQTSTEPLAAKLAAFNPEVAIFPNQVATLPPLTSASPDAPVRLFFGALNREADWAPHMATLNDVLRQRPEVAVEVVHDRRFFNEIATANKHFTATCPTDQYYRLLAGADICFMPLGDTPFNRMKSDLKFIEAAARGVVALASPVVYEASIVDGETGVLFRDPSELGERLLRLIDNRSLRQRIAQNAYTYVRRDRMLAQHADLRLAWYRRLLEHRDWLTASLRQRCPEIFA